MFVDKGGGQARECGKKTFVNGIIPGAASWDPTSKVEVFDVGFSTHVVHTHGDMIVVF